MKKYRIIYACPEAEKKRFMTEYETIEKIVPKDSPDFKLAKMLVIQNVNQFHTALNEELETLERDQQAILQLVGHGNRYGIEMTGAAADYQGNDLINPESALKYFQKFEDRIAFVIFSSCASIEVAECVSKAENIQGVIGLTSRIEDLTCITFTEHFYKHFSAYKDFNLALEHAKNGKILANEDNMFWGSTKVPVKQKEKRQRKHKGAKSKAPKETEDGSLIGIDYTSKLREVGVDLRTTTEDLLKELENSWGNRTDLDQKFLYMQPLSAKYWKDLINSHDYNIYNSCLNALNKTLDSTVWQGYVRQKEISSIVNLGVGAGDKDNQIIKSFISISEKKQKVKYAIVDTSFPMLEMTMNSINKFVLENKDIIEFRSLKSDFMKMGPHIEGVFSPPKGTSGGVAYFSLGCTFSNLSETTFFKSLGKVIKKNDLFVLGVELYDSDDPTGSMENLKQSYDTESMRKLAIISSKMVEDEVSFYLNDKEDKIGIHVDDSTAYTDVPKGSSIIITYRGVVVAASSRYDERELIKFCARRGYHKVWQESSSENKLYRHYIFKYVK